jgi:PAS domain S-box-containing protein
MRWIWKRGFGIAPVLFVLMLFTAAPFSDRSDAQEVDEIRVALSLDYLPLSGTSITGEPSGMLVDVWRLWSEKTGIPVSFTSKEFTDTISDLRHDRVDVHGSLFRNDIREVWLKFSRPLHEVTTGAYYMRSQGPVLTLLDIGKRRIGVISGTHQEAHMLQGEHSLKVTSYTQPSELVEALASGEVDLLIHEDLAMSRLLDRTGLRGDVARVPGEIMRNTVLSAWKRIRPELRPVIDWGFSLISQEELAEIERRWISDPEERFFRPPGSVIPLTNAEKEWLKRNKVIRVGFQANWPPMTSVEEGHNPEGMSIEFIRLINQQLGGIMTLVPGNWNDLLEDVEDKRLDAVVDIWPIRSRMGKFSFSIPYLTVPQVLVSRDGGLQNAGLGSLGGKTAAIEKSYAMGDYIRTRHPEINVTETDDSLAALRAVAAGEADFWAGNLAVAQYLIETYPSELGGLKIGSRLEGQASSLTIGVREDWGLFRNILNKAITAINPAQKKFITDPWLSGRVNEKIELSFAEQRWLTRNRDNLIRVLAEDWPPFNYRRNGDPAGMAIDYVRFAFEELGLQAEFVDMPWSDALDGISGNGTLDVIPALSQTVDREEFLEFTAPYLSFPTVIFTRDDGSIISELDDLAGKKVAVENGFITEEILAREHPEIELVRYGNTHDAIKAVSVGQADAYIGNLASGTFYIQQDGLSNISVAAPTGYDLGENAMGIRKDWPELASMLDKVLAQMTPEEHTRIRSSALAVHYESGVDIRVILSYALPAAAAVLFIVIVIFISNRKLSREVKERKRVQEELAESESWFKSLLESAPDATIIVDQRGNIVRVNKQAELLFKVNREDIIDQKIEVLVPDDIKPRHVGYRHGFVTASAPRAMAANMKLQARRWDGSQFPVEISLSPIETQHGTLIAAAVRDVTERRAAERALEEKDIQLTAALENMSGGMFMIDRDLRIRVFNRNFVELYNLPSVRIGIPLRELMLVRAERGDYGPGNPGDLVEQRLAGYRDKSITKIEDRVGGKIIEGYRQPTSDGGMVCIFNDITVRKKAEETLALQTSKLQDLSTTLSRYLSPQIYEAIFAGATDANVRTERKKLTVFFSDIKSFTATTEEMEPEDMTFLLNDYLTKMTQIALEHGGTIDKYVGDAIMVFFGDPETKGVKQDAMAAVRMAVAMQRRMVDLRAKWADMGFRYPFHIRCGINTGYCNVGNFGSEQRVDYTIIGGQVNLAARLESICPVDGITISRETYSHVRDEFDAEAMDPIEVKGIREPVEPYSVSGIFEDWDESERYIRKDDVSGLRIWVDLMRMTEEQRLASMKELEEVLGILGSRKLQG